MINYAREEHKKYSVNVNKDICGKIEIRNDYSKWLKENAPVKDSIVTFLTYLDEMGYLVEDAFV